MRSWALVFCILSIGGACDSADKGAIVEPDTDPGKGDVASRVEDQGALGFGAARASVFTEDLSFHGFHLSVRAGAVVTLDNTHLGTAAKLDSTLFVYGPRDGEGFGTAAIAFDDDSGWGRHARIRDLRLERAGEYLVVLGTADGRGRGQYRLEARCESGACEPAAPPASCDAQLSAGIQRCLVAQIADGDLEGDATTSYHEALAVCTDGEALGAIFDELCVRSPAPAFCDLDFETFYTTQVPGCDAELGARFGLCGSYLSDALALVTEGMLFTSESDYPYETLSWSGQGAPTGPTVLALSGLDPASTVETAEFERIFSWIGRPIDPDMDEDEREQVRRNRHLRRVLEGNLSDTLVVRIGAIQIRVFLVGQTSCGELAGLVTTSIET